MSSHSSITGKVALITGASSGIGRGVAISFAGQGCRLAITGRDLANLDKTKAQCVKQGLAPESVLVIVADLMKNDDVERIMAETVASFGQLDILINNAGIFLVGGIETFSMELYHQLMQVNVHSLVLLTKLAIPYLEKTKGCIVNVSSILGVRPDPEFWAYCMTKAALNQFCRSLALELAPKGIRVNNVNPGVILTDIFLRSGQTEEEFEEFLEQKCPTLHALQRYGDVPEVTGVISFLVSERAEYTTGATLLMDGGRHVMAYQQPLGQF